MKLTPRQERFVEEYLIDLNAAQAAVRAGYSVRGADACGARLLAHPGVRARVDPVVRRQAGGIGITADAVLREVARVAFFDLRRVFAEDGTLIPVAALPEEVSAALLSADFATARRAEGRVEHVAKLKAADKMRALEMLGRHLGLFRERGEATPRDGGKAGATEDAPMTAERRARRVEDLLRQAAARPAPERCGTEQQQEGGQEEQDDPIAQPSAGYGPPVEEGADGVGGDDDDC